jgi:hypothetical protein
MCDLVFDPTHLNREYLIETLALTNRPYQPFSKYRQMPAPYRNADVIETIATFYMDFFGIRIWSRFDPTQLNRGWP